jgi:hypothetical protein
MPFSARQSRRLDPEQAQSTDETVFQKFLSGDVRAVETRREFAIGHRKNARRVPMLGVIESGEVAADSEGGALPVVAAPLVN